MTDAAHPADTLARLASEAAQLIRDRTGAVAKALEQLAKSRGEPAKLRLLTLPPPPACDYRVFRSTITGVHLVLRNVETLPGFEPVLGPQHPDGKAVTFEEAIAFANQGLAQLVAKLKSANQSGGGMLDLEETAATVLAAAKINPDSQ
ncbi:MAG TPA: hypothetical protein VHH73_08270 [Verrucomicrobiae bacterium]|nr:hypothetical protein [Verrucomicrobiae bacterium]